MALGRKRGAAASITGFQPQGRRPPTGLPGAPPPPPQQRCRKSQVCEEGHLGARNHISRKKVVSMMSENPE